MTTTTAATHPTPLDAAGASGSTLDAVFTRLASSEHGLTQSEAAARLEAFGPNALTVQRVSALAVFVRQLRNPLLLLLLAAAAVSGLTGDPTDAAIIAAIVALSVGLGFVNEYRAANAVAALHRDIRHEALVWRDGQERSVDVAALVPGDVVALRVGDIVPADLRLIDATQLECDEAVLTGESLPVAKSASGRQGRRLAARPAGLCLHGHRGAPGRRARRRHRDGQGDGVRRHRRGALRAPGGHRLPGRPARLLAPARESGRRPHRVDLRDQRGLLAATHRRAPVLARDRDRHHAATPAGDRLGEPVERVAHAGAQTGARQAPRDDRGPRQHRGALHGQDGDAHRGRGHVPRRARHGRGGEPRGVPLRAALQRDDDARRTAPRAATRSISRSSPHPRRPRCWPTPRGCPRTSASACCRSTTSASSPRSSCAPRRARC